MILDGGSVKGYIGGLGWRDSNSSGLVEVCRARFVENLSTQGTSFTPPPPLSLSSYIRLNSNLQSLPLSHQIKTNTGVLPSIFPSRVFRTASLYSSVSLALCSSSLLKEPNHPSTMLPSFCHLMVVKKQEVTYLGHFSRLIRKVRHGTTFVSHTSQENTNGVQVIQLPREKPS